MSKQVEVPEGKRDVALWAAREVETGTTPEAEAARVLRKFMCCEAGRDLVEYGLLRPFGLTSRDPKAICKHFEERLLSDESVNGIAEWLFGEEMGEHSESVRTALRAQLEVLQAASIPGEGSER